MKFSLAIFTLGQLQELLLINERALMPDQILLYPRQLSRAGSMSIEDLEQAALLLRKNQFKTEFTLVWDILMTESELEKALSLLTILEKKFASHGFDDLSWRVQDAGAMYWIKKNRLSSKLELILQAGFNNSSGILKMVEFYFPNVRKVILSQELPHEEIKVICENLKKFPSVACEILGLGPIPLFYSPRHLLRPHLEQNSNEQKIMALGTSDETAHRNFTILDNDHGTFMWFPKDLYILEHLDLIQSIGVEWVRAEFLNQTSLALGLNLALIFKSFNLNDSNWQELAVQFKTEYGKPTIKGFFNNNRTDSLFKKLKNQLLVHTNRGWIGDVMDLDKGRYLAFKIKAPHSKISLGEKLRMQTPEGKEKEIDLHFIKNSRNENVESAVTGDLVMIPHVSGACVGSVLYKM